MGGRIGARTIDIEGAAADDESMEVPTGSLSVVQEAKSVKSVKSVKGGKV
jgi:hypothetical protein